MGSIVGAAEGEKIFFDHIEEHKATRIFIPQRWVISFHFAWYKIETGGDGVQYVEGVPYWFDSERIAALVAYIQSQEANTNANA